MKISKKLILSMLALTLGTLLLAEVGLFAVIADLKEATRQMYGDLRTDAEQTIEEGLYSMDSDSLGVIADLQTEVTDSRLRIVADAVEQTAEFAERLYASPAEHASSVYTPVHLSEAPDTLSARYMFSAGVEEAPALYRELAMIANMEEIFAPIMRYNSRFLDNLYVGTASGIFYQYTDNNVFLENYVVTQRHWYVSSTGSPDQIMWKETEIDSYGRPCITASKAVKDPAGNVVAVVAADVNFEQMMSNVIGSGLGETGTTFILGADRDLLAYTDFMKDAQAHNNVSFNAFNDHFADPETALEKIDACAYGNGDAFHAELDGREIYMTARVIPCTGWLLCTAINAEEITTPIEHVRLQSDQTFSAAQTKMTARFKSLIAVAVVTTVLLALTAVVLAYFIARTISRPIVRLTDTVKNTGEGDFDRKSDIDTHDEIGDLARGFNKMQDDLKHYTEHLKTVTAEKERIGAELNVATQIQADMLPRIFPPFPQKREINLFASMNPAKEVGGDFFDFFLVDNNHLALVIADVSGKGVPAALFMVISKTLIKNRVMQGGTPAEILADVNNQLCEGNEADMFVTCWLGICDLSTGIITAASAGHEFPAVCGANRTFELFRDKHGFVLAGMEGARYRDYEIRLERGGSVFVYTDGVPEATDAGSGMFGAERMLDALNRNADHHPEAFIGAVGDAVREFTGDAPQFDDITMVGMTWYGKNGAEAE